MGKEEFGLYLLNRILDKTEGSSCDWKGQKDGGRSYKIHQEDYQRRGRKELIQDLIALEKRGLVQVKWYSWHSEPELVKYRLCQLPEFCRLTGRKMKLQRVREELALLDEWGSRLQSGWLKDYYRELREKIAGGKSLEKTLHGGTALLSCLSALEGLQEPMYIRIFSKQYLGSSKVFERKLRSEVISIARRYHPEVDEAMSEEEVLSQLYLEHYAQELALKGELRIRLEGREIDLSDFRYGLVLNAETLKHAEPIPSQGRLKRIITVENKANYTWIPWEKGTLILFSHGFFSPRERAFLRRLAQTAPQAEYFHTGDLDYGGARIFRYIRTQIFPALKPLWMDAPTYDRYLPEAVEMEDSAWEKIKGLEAEEPLLKPLIARIREEKKVIEQEAFLFGRRMPED